MAKANNKKSVAAEVEAASAAPAEKKATVSKGPKGVLPTETISMLVAGNPKREGSKAKVRFDLYRDGMTVAEALEAGITTPDLIYDTSHGFVKITNYNPELAPVKEKKEPKPKDEKKLKATKNDDDGLGDDGEELE